MQCRFCRATDELFQALPPQTRYHGMRIAVCLMERNCMTTRYRQSLSALALTGLALVSAVPAAAQDRSVATRLDKEGLKYEVDKDGDYKLLFDYSDEGRTQIVFVSGATQTVSGMTIREIFAPAARVEEDKVTGSKALVLLEDSSTNKVGSWEIRGNVLYFVIKVPESLTSTELGALAKIAAESADNKEIELTGGGDEL
jgi:hypothetical protein